MDNRARFLALMLAILAAAAMRLLPHPPNFSPVEAVALFGGFTGLYVLLTVVLMIMMGKTVRIIVSAISSTTDSTAFLTSAE